jgi:hypothetical protein
MSPRVGPGLTLMAVSLTFAASGCGSFLVQHVVIVDGTKANDADWGFQFGPGGNPLGGNYSDRLPDGSGKIWYVHNCDDQCITEMAHDVCLGHAYARIDPPPNGWSKAFRCDPTRCQSAADVWSLGGCVPNSATP